MKKVIFIVCLWAVLPCCLKAQTAAAYLQQVTTQITAKKWKEAADAYRQAIGADVRRAEIYYRTEVDKNIPVAMRFAEELAVYYKNTRDYERAYTYYGQLLEKKPTDVNYLSGSAECAFGLGKTDEAVTLYGQIISIDTNNLRANIFLGSYYFMRAEQSKKQLDKAFLAIKSPTSMQRARYHDDLKALFGGDYTRAKNYLDSVQKLFRSTEAVKMLATIGEREKEING
jgi:tetratricopeptide (TPR) repeat protein